MQEIRLSIDAPRTSPTHTAEQDPDTLLGHPGDVIDVMWWHDMHQEQRHGSGTTGHDRAYAGRREPPARRTATARWWRCGECGAGPGGGWDGGEKGPGLLLSEAQ